MDLSKAHLHWRVSRRNGKEYKSYSLARAFRENGKNRKQILLKLGKLSDAEVNQWKKALLILKGRNAGIASLDEIITVANYAYLDIAVLLETWHSWDLNKIFADDRTRDVPLWAVAATLTINRCVNPLSKSQVCSWFPKTFLPFILNIQPSQMNPSRIFRELSAIEELKSDLSEHLYKEVAKRDPSSMESVFYDLSSTTFSGTKCLLMDWGFCKEGYENHMVLALVVNKKGLPIYWETLQGCTSDATTIELLVRNLKSRFEIATSTMVFDRGMVSDENLILLESFEIKYISAMDRNQIEGLADVDFSHFSVATLEEAEKKVQTMSCFTKLNDTTYYHEVKSEEVSKRRYILCFNPQLCSDQKKAQRQAIAKFESSVRSINQELLCAKNSRSEESSLNKFKNEMSIEQKGYLEIKLRKKTIELETEQGTKRISTYQGKVVIDEQKWQTAGRLDGFWMLVTNHNERTENGAFSQDAEAVIKPYREKVVIESAFRDIKSCIEIAPVHVWTLEHVKAHYTICVLAYLLDRTLTLKLHERPGICSEKVVAHTRLYSELETCLINHTKVAGTSMEAAGLTQPTPVQKELIERIGLTHLLQEDLIKKYFDEVASYV